jgi:hypothetical protein
VADTRAPTLGGGTVSAGAGLRTSGGGGAGFAFLTHDGTRVRPRGVAMGDPLLARRDRTVDDYRVVAGGAWRGDIVRVSVHPGPWRDRRSDATGALVRDVDAALGNAMWVVIEWHAIGWPDGACLQADPGWGLGRDPYDTTFALAQDFWDRVSRGKYAADGRVAFELWNEPAHNDPARGQDWGDLRACHERLLATIRRNGASNLVLCSGPGWSYDLRGIGAAPVDDPLGNVGYAWHCYPNNDGDDPTLWARRLDDLDRIYPVVVTEWGFCRTAAGAHYLGTPESFGEPFVSFVNGRGMPWIGWCWHPFWGPPMLRPDWATPTEFGRFVRSSLAQAPSGGRPGPTGCTAGEAGGGVPPDAEARPEGDAGRVARGRDGRKGATGRPPHRRPGR